MKISAIAIVALAACSTQAFAASDTNRTIVNLGATNTGYVQVAEGFSQPCKYSLVYLPDLSQPNAKAMMAVLLSAQARRAPVTVTYDMDASGICTANLVASQ
ncbi:hypothetical protein ACQKIE_01220 [Luteibacter sp. NPDC031894]|uniref:hypothetical protein n=1 Tax=Luteibacter sp. NPDC031894 TaxID=3390572 RepID=UPI003D05668F